MKRLAFVTTLTILTLSACGKEAPKEPFVPSPINETAPIPPLPAGHPVLSPSGQVLTPADAAQAEPTETATVVSSIDVPQFTYIEITQNGQTRWLAAKTIATKKGDVIHFDTGSNMVNFSSTTLNRTFPSITFVNKVTIGDGK